MTMQRNVARGVAIALSLVGLLGGALSEAQVTTGTIGRGVLYAPGTQTVDVSLARTFPIWKTFRLQFRADAFNLFNTPQFGFPNSAIGSPTAGRITTTIADNRSLQFALKLDW